ncbi:MAG: type I glutamate--ammonia ligase [Anaerolineae bacterium]|nr:type I glutamate--ammonia ligase [Anaerolineae bacterium]
MFDVDTILARLREEDIRSVDMQFTDVAGMIKTVSLDAEQLPDALDTGVWFDGSAVEGSARVAESDMYLRPDLSTFAVLPWEVQRPEVGRTARLICDVYTPNGQPFAGDPRGALRRALGHATRRGIHYRVAPELEFYLFRKPPGDKQALRPDDQSGYFDASDGVSRVIRKRVSDALRTMNITVVASHHEVGSGQHELDLAPQDALHMADAIVTARMAVRTIAHQEGRFATFMPKPLTNSPGSGMHLHQQLYDNEGHNRFTDTSDDYGLSAEAKAFLAGQLKHARAICALLAPLVNSYKRLMAGLEAPIYVTWAQLNRGALLRVPRLTEPAQSGTQIEMRCPDPSCNPYLAFTMLLHAGLDGIDHQLPLPPAAEEELYELTQRRRHLITLPTSLHEALDELEASDLARNALGLHLFERFLEAKRIEWANYLPVVSPWELDRYLSTY